SFRAQPPGCLPVAFPSARSCRPSASSFDYEIRESINAQQPARRHRIVGIDALDNYWPVKLVAHAERRSIVNGRFQVTALLPMHLAEALRLDLHDLGRPRC